MPSVPPDVPVVGDTRVRSAFTQILAIAGQALPPSVMLAYGYLAANAGQGRGDLRQAFRKTVQNLGVIWGLFSVMVIVAGATALHAVYTGTGPTYLGVSHYSQIESIPVAGQVLGPAFPGALSFLAPRFFSLGSDRGSVHDADLRVADDDLLLPRHGAAELAIHQRQHHVQDGCSRPGSSCRRCSRRSGSCPSLLKAILAMVGNLALAPIAVLVILYFVNRQTMGEFRAGPGRNAVLIITALFATALVINGVIGMFR